MCLQVLGISTNKCVITRFNRGLCWLVLLLCALALPVVCAAQVLYGSITGVVTDPSNAAVPDAQIVALNINTGTSQTATTDSTGLFRINDLSPGTYKITISAKNF